MTVEEFYNTQFTDRDTPTFLELGDKIESGVNGLFLGKPATYKSSIISIK